MSLPDVNYARTQPATGTTKRLVRDENRISLSGQLAGLAEKLFCGRDGSDSLPWMEGIRGILFVDSHGRKIVVPDNLRCLSPPKTLFPFNLNLFRRKVFKSRSSCG